MAQRRWANLALIAAGSYAVARAANAYVAHRTRVIPRIDDPAFDFARRHTPRSSQARRPFTAIAERNLLNAKRENLNPAAPAIAPPASPTRYDEDDLQPCSIPFQLRGTLVAAERPSWSAAVVYDSRARKSRVVSTGDRNNSLGRDGTVVAIRSREIIVRRTDHFELCKAGKNKRPHYQVRNNHHLTPRGVKRVGSNVYAVNREFVDRSLGNINKVATQARIVPSFKNGKSNGFKLFSIKPGSVYATLGLRNGDIVHKVNGHLINSPDRAIELYQDLKTVASLRVQLLRRGKALTMNYSIQ